jgi:hypothetical protein
MLIHPSKILGGGEFMKRYVIGFFLLTGALALLAPQGSAWSHSLCAGAPYYPGGDLRGVHHYVYAGGYHYPQWYRYDPHPNYRRFTYQFPPHYTARPLEYYMGLDQGRVQDYRPSWESVRY